MQFALDPPICLWQCLRFRCFRFGRCLRHKDFKDRSGERHWYPKPAGVTGFHPQAKINKTTTPKNNKVANLLVACFETTCHFSRFQTLAALNGGSCNEMFPCQVRAVLNLWLAHTSQHIRLIGLFWAVLYSAAGFLPLCIKFSKATPFHSPCQVALHQKPKKPVQLRSKDRLSSPVETIPIPLHSGQNQNRSTPPAGHQKPSKFPPKPVSSGQIPPRNIALETGQMAPLETNNRSKCLPAETGRNRQKPAKSRSRNQSNPNQTANKGQPKVFQWLFSPGAQAFAWPQPTLV